MLPGVDSLADLVERACATHADRIAFRLEGPEPQAWSYRRVGVAVEAIARHLRRACGIERGERLVVWGAASSPHLTATYLGCIRAGIVLVPVDPRSHDEFVQRIADATEARAVVVDGPRGEALSLPRIRLEDLPDGLAAPEGDPLPDRPAADDLAEVVFTSGTTGEPKGVMLTHANILANLDAITEVVPRREYRLVSLLPLSHMLEQTPGIFMAMEYGADVAYVTSRQPATILGAMQRRRPNLLVVVPLILELLMRGIEREVRGRGLWRAWQAMHLAARPLPMPARRLLFRPVLRQLGGELETLFCGGARLEPPLARAWERLGVRVAEGYGATECAPVVTANRLDHRVIGSVGTPLRNVEVRVSPEGELQVRGPNVFQGYWRNPQATAEAFTADGWYRSGDLAEIDAEGNVRLHGRLRDLIVLPSGMNVYPEDVEAALRAEPEIGDCVVLLLPDAHGRPRLQAVVAASVTGQAPSDDDRALAEAVRRANRRLAPHQRVMGHLRWPEKEFPRTTSMKVRRAIVQRRMEDSAARA